MDEFDSIARLFRPLATSPEALGLMDDAAVLAARPGYDLVVTADAIVEGIHFLPDDPADLVARKLLRVNLSDLAAKAAEPYGYMLTVAWSPAWDEARRSAFARGLGEDQAAYRLKLFGGDTVSTPGPMSASVTMFGWVESGRMVKRSGARAGDLLLVSGTIGDGYLGLKAARGEFAGPDAALLADRYRLPQPRLALRNALKAYATAAADVSDGLLADALHICRANGLGLEVELGDLPVSVAAANWLAVQGDRTDALMDLATGGDDYEVVCTVHPDCVSDFIGFAHEHGVEMMPVGRVTAHRNISVSHWGEAACIEIDRLGWRHG